MIRLALASLCACALLGSACSNGGQTYDDGSDGVRSTDDGSGGDTGDDGSPPDDEDDDDDGATECGDLREQALDVASDLRDQADKSCETPSDCMRMGSTPSCVDSCGGGVVVSMDGAETIIEGLEELEGGVCADFDDANCKLTVSGCPGEPPMEIACVNGTCESLTAEDVGGMLDPDPPGTGGAGGRENVAGGTSVSEGGSGGTTTAPGGSGGTDAGGEAGADAGSPATDCYGPEENLDLAYSGELDGCACGDVGDICIGPVGLSCDDGTWQAVEDGPCFPEETPCDGRVDSPTTCVELFSTCRELSTGTFCGSGRRTDLCDDGEIVQNSGGCLQDDAFCRELPNGLYCTGSSAATCPEGYTPDPDCNPDLPSCIQISESLRCRVPAFELDECGDAGGEVIGDPGDGSVFSQGCPDGRTLLGTVNGCIEGCLCCAP